MKYSNNFIFILLIIGVFFPTSINGEIITNLIFVKISIFYLIATYLILKQGYINRMLTCLFIIIFSLLLLFTATADSTQYAYGTIIYYIAFALLLNIDLKRININKIFFKYWLLFNFVLLAIGYLIVFNITFIDDFIIQFYSSHKSFLVWLMLLQNKPVLTFGSHSIASVFIFFLFYINFNIFKVLKSKVYLLIGVAYIILIYFLNSNSSLLFFLLGLIYILINWIRYLNLKSIILSFLVSPIILIPFIVDIVAFTQNAFQTALLIISSPANGILGRFSENGALITNIIHISNHPLQGIGFARIPSLILTDSGFIELTLRGTLILTICFYLAVYIFLRHNLYNQQSAIFIFIVFFIFDAFAYPLYKETFTPFLFIIMIIILNYLDNLKDDYGHQNIATVTSFSSLNDNKCTSN